MQKHIWRSSVLFVLLSLIPLRGNGAEVRFKLPSDGAAQLWQAEKAKQDGGWQVVSSPRATGGAYVEPSCAEGVVLEFPLEAKKEGTIAVWPVWWRTGERKEAKRFPQHVPYFNLEQVWPIAWPAANSVNMEAVPVFERTGPDVIDVCGDKLFFTAPTTGRVGVVDAKSEKLVGCVEVGGYVGDLVADGKSGKMFVADSAG
ncbi:MAG: hypothetical protein FJ279_23490, partial [Planctomycetes bacterium]|nr:hypothetical protein [Planctomycetota bacterium]